MDKADEKRRLLEIPVAGFDQDNSCIFNLTLEELGVTNVDALIEFIDQARREEREKIENLGFRPGFQFFRDWLNRNYPELVFVTSSKDSDIGVKIVVDFRRLFRKYKDIIDSVAP